MDTSHAPRPAAATLEPGAPAGADVARLVAGRWPLAAQLPPRTRAGGARRLTREYTYLLSSYTAESCEPLPAFNTARGAGVAGDAIRTAQPGIEYTLLVRDRGTTEWRTTSRARTIAEAIAFYWPAS